MPERIEITLPWPPKSLSPNARGHWAKKAKAAEIYRYTCKVESLLAIRKAGSDLKPLRDIVDAGGEIHVFLEFCPPNRRARDDDNVVAAFKSGRDGLADALGIDDCHFRTHPFLKRDEIVKPLGEIRVVVTGQGPGA